MVKLNTSVKYKSGCQGSLRQNIGYHDEKVSQYGFLSEHVISQKPVAEHEHQTAESSKQVGGVKGNKREIECGSTRKNPYSA